MVTAARIRSRHSSILYIVDRNPLELRATLVRRSSTMTSRSSPDCDQRYGFGSGLIDVATLEESLVLPTVSFSRLGSLMDVPQCPIVKPRRLELLDAAWRIRFVASGPSQTCV